MPQYILKDALIAEIKRIEHETNYEPFTDEVLGKRYICKSLLSFIDTLEVKDVDLEKEVCDWYNNRYKPIDKNCDFEKYTGHWLEKSTIIDLAKHFFELGLKAQKGE